jgi:methyl-accepting chemotaxis protein
MSDSNDGIRGTILSVSRSVVPDRLRKSYALKFGAWFVVLAVVVGVLGLFVTSTLAEDVRNNTDDDLVRIADQTADGIENWNERNEELNELVARNVDPSNTNQGIEDRLENESLGAMPGYVRSLHYVNVDSDAVIASTSDNNEVGERLSAIAAGGEMEAPQAWAAAENLDFEGETGISGLYVEDGTTKIAYYRRADGSGQERALVLVADPSEANVSLGAGGATGFAQVVNGSGTVVFDQGGERYGQSYGGWSDLEGSLDSPGVTKNSGTQAASDALSTDSYLVVHTGVEGTDWTVLLHQDPSEAYGFAANVQNLGLLATLGLVVLVGLFATTLSLRTSRSIDRLTDKAQRIEEEDLEVDFSSGRVDSIGQLYDAFGEMQVSLREQIQRVQTERERAERLNEHLERKASDYSEVMNAASEGDLTRRMDPESENEAMTEIATAYNGMVDDIEATVLELQYFSADVATASEDINEYVENIRTASEQVTESVQEISDGADRQSEQFQAVSTEVDQLSSTTEEIAATSDDVAEVAEMTAEAGREGREAAEEAIESVDSIERGADQAVDAMARLDEEMEEIDELVEFISEMANQTNMLALNANIEATRGGGDAEGDEEGFSAVAEEIKELASESANAADDVEELLARIRERTDTAVAEVKDASDRIEQNESAIRNAADALEDIADYAERTNDGVQEIRTGTQQQAESTAEIVPMVEDSAEIAQETSSQAQDVAAAAEEQTSALAEADDSLTELARKAETLEAELRTFEAQGQAAKTSESEN